MSKDLQLSGFRVSLEGEEAVCRLVTTDDFGLEPMANMQAEFGRAFQADGPLAGKRLVVDLDAVRAISSRQLGSLLALHQAAGRKHKLVVRGAGPNIRELFDVTRMDQYFEY